MSWLVSESMYASLTLRPSAMPLRMVFHMPLVQLHELPAGRLAHLVGGVRLHGALVGANLGHLPLHADLVEKVLEIE